MGVAGARRRLVMGCPQCRALPPTPLVGPYGAALLTQQRALDAGRLAANLVRRRRAALASLTCHRDCTSGFYSPAVEPLVKLQKPREPREPKVTTAAPTKADSTKATTAAPTKAGSTKATTAAPTKAGSTKATAAALTKADSTKATTAALTKFDSRDTRRLAGLAADGPREPTRKPTREHTVPASTREPQDTPVPAPYVGNPCAGPGMCINEFGFCSTDPVECAVGKDCSSCAQVAVPTPSPPTPGPNSCPPSCRGGGVNFKPRDPCRGCMTAKGACLVMTATCVANLGEDCRACVPVAAAADAGAIAAKDTPAQKVAAWNAELNAGTGTCPDGAGAACTAGSTTARCGPDLALLVPNTCSVGESKTSASRFAVELRVLPDVSPKDPDAARRKQESFLAMSRDGDNAGLLMEDLTLRNKIIDLEATNTAELTGNTFAQELAAVKAFDDDDWFVASTSARQSLANAP